MSDTPLTIELDVGSFNLAERRELQQAFKQDYHRLQRHVASTIYQSDENWEAAKPLESFDGQPVYADQVFIRMLHIARCRTDPTADIADLERLSLGELREAVSRGRADRPKAKKAAKRSKK